MDSIFMYVFYAMFGFRRNKTLRTDYWAGKYHCPSCGEKKDFHLMKNTRDFCFLVFPMVESTDDRFLCCDSCNYTKKLRIREYSKIRKNQIEQLRLRKYPAEMVENDFAAKNVPLVKKIVKLALTGILSLLMLASAIGSIWGFGVFAGSPYGEFFLWLWASIPFIFSLKAILPELRKRFFYKNRDSFRTNNEMKVSYPFVQDIIDQKEDYDKLLGDMKNSKMEDVFEKTVSEDEKADTNPVESTYPSGRGWLQIGAFFSAAPRKIMQHPELHCIFTRLMGKKFRAFLIVQLITLLFGLCVFFAGFNTIKTGGEDMELVILWVLALLTVSVVFNVVNRVQSARVVKGLIMLKETGYIRYINEVMPHIGTTTEPFVFGEHLFYDRGSRLVAAYDNILWAYSVVDDNNQNRAVLHMADGRRYVSVMNLDLFKAFLDKQPHILAGRTEENAKLYKQKVADRK